MASALQLLDEEKTRETRLFIRMMDRFFDALNVKNPLEGKHKRKDSRAPYYSTKDERFKVYYYRYWGEGVGCRILPLPKNDIII